MLLYKKGMLSHPLFFHMDSKLIIIASGEFNVIVICRCDSQISYACFPDIQNSIVKRSVIILGKLVNGIIRHIPRSDKSARFRVVRITPGCAVSTFESIIVVTDSIRKNSKVSFA